MMCCFRGHVAARTVPYAALSRIEWILMSPIKMHDDPPAAFRLSGQTGGLESPSGSRAGYRSS
jgi:hypothetical protein